jgi:hypothetical protein
MVSKQVTDRVRSSSQVTATVEVNANEVDQKLRALLSVYLEAGESMPDVALFVRLIRRHLLHASSELNAADLAHESEIADDAQPRVERDEAEADLRDTVVNYRNAVSVGYGEAATRAHAVGSAAPSDARGLLRYAKDFHAGLVDAARAPSTRPRGGLVVDRAILAAELAPRIARLDAALEVVDREAAELRLTQTAKDSAIAANDVAFSGVANAMEGLLILAGRRDLADRVRPSARRAGVVDQEVAEPIEKT